MRRGTDLWLFEIHQLLLHLHFIVKDKLLCLPIRSSFSLLFELLTLSKMFKICWLCYLKPIVHYYFILPCCLKHWRLFWSLNHFSILIFGLLIIGFVLLLLRTGPFKLITLSYLGQSSSLMNLILISDVLRMLLMTWFFMLFECLYIHYQLFEVINVPNLVLG